MPWNVIGHEWAVDMLRRDLAHDRVRHAYLFTGPAGVGKRTLAHEFSRALLCEMADPPCGRCRHCLLSARGSHADLLTVEPTVSGKSVRTAKIKIEPVRAMMHDLSVSPVEARRRVARIWRFDTANAEAMNAFLKTLEEPPGQAVILLTAERADDLLPTIVSRCESWRCALCRWKQCKTPSSPTGWSPPSGPTCWLTWPRGASAGQCA